MHSYESQTRFFTECITAYSSTGCMPTDGIQDYFVELEQMPDGRSQMAGVKDCAAYLQNAPFVK